MPRNFDRRVEIVFPIEDERLKTRVVDEIRADTTFVKANVRLLLSDGTYDRLRGGFNCHEVLEQIASGARASFSLPERETPSKRISSTPAAS